MKFLYLFTAVFVTTSSAFEVQKFGGTRGWIHQLQFDSKSNTFFISYGGGHEYYDQFIKLDANNEQVLLKEIGDIYNIFVTKKDDVYVFGTENRFSDVKSVWRLKANTNDLELLFKYPRNNYYKTMFNSFIDSQDNIYFNSRSGVNFLRTDQNIPLVIRDLEGVVFNSSVEDESGNVYLRTTGDFITVITKEAKESPVPYARLLPIPEKTMVNFTNWNNVTFLIEKENNVATVTSLTAGKKEVLLSQYDVDYFFFGSTDERLFLVENNTFTNITHLYYITPLLKVVKVEENLNSSLFIRGGKFAFDKDGTAHFAYQYDKKYQIVSLKFHDNKIKKVYVPDAYNNQIYALDVDDNGDLWIVADQLYLLKKDSDVLVPMFKFDVVTSEHFSVKVKKETGDLYLGTYIGLYIATNNK